MPKRWIKVNLADATDAAYAEMVDEVEDVLRKSGERGSVQQDGGKVDYVGD